MKFKRLILSATAVAASSSLLATVLTSCSKADIDEDLIIDLDDTGLFGTVGSKNFDYKSAIKAALTRSSGWKTFKEALADEIVYQWYENRASKTTKSHDKNDKFRDNLEEWKYKSNKEYDEIVDKCKSSYGANYKFYLQNEYLSQYGGTKDSYIHSKMVAHVKEEFTKAVFADNFFGIRTEDEDDYYPQIFTEAKNSVDFAPLNDPDNWSKLGFYGKTKVGYEPVRPENDLKWPEYLAAHPEGDYATIQDYVFNRWFDDEKPFFSAAALFKYTNPTTSGSALADIYNPNRATLPTDGPNEAFPFFGGIAINSNEGEKGVHAYWDWYWNLYNGAFETPGMYGDVSSPSWNWTITIPKTSTDDSQTLLLCTANDMFNTLYTPYAVAAANLYGRMFSDDGKSIALNTYTQQELQANVSKTLPQDQDDDSILKNFFRITFPNASYIKSCLDLNTIYGGANGTTSYHCPLFMDNKFFKYFYGGNDGNFGVRYIINNLEADLGKWDGVSEEAPAFIDQQPWALELNQAGMHAQTIDGYLYVRGEGHSTADQKMQRLKEVFKYRVMQKYCNYDGGLISCDLFSTDGAGRLEKYFTEHYADIILELAMEASSGETGKYNIFRKIESYKPSATTFANADLFLYQINLTDNLVPENSYANLITFLTSTIEIDRKKKVISSVESINDKIYSYRSTQIENSKSDVGKKRFENGLLGKMPLTYISNSNFRTTRYYDAIINGIFVTNPDEYFLPNGETDLLDRFKELIISGETINDKFIKYECSTTIQCDLTFGFSPQIKDAKKVMSNRFWYKSAIVDKLMYAFMADKGNANAIKDATYKAYDLKTLPIEEGKPSLDSIIHQNQDANYYNHSFYSTYIKSKLFSESKNFASYSAPSSSMQYFHTMEEAYEKLQQSYVVENGEFNDEALNFQLFISTIGYLSRPDKDGNYFANFYKWLDSKILNNETAYVGYLSQFNAYHEPEDIDKPLLEVTSGPTPYDWTGNVDNIFDRIGYAGNIPTATDFSVASSVYWNVVNTEIGSTPKTFAGFTGLQTAKNNIFNSESGLQVAAFGSDDGLHNFAQATYKSPILGGAAGQIHKQNDGALFPWSGKDDTKYHFADVKDPKPDSTEPVVKYTDIYNNVSPRALRLAYMIYEMDNKDDLLELATKLANAIYGKSMFRDIVSGDVPLYRPELTDSIRYWMLRAILEQDSGEYRWKNAFDRVSNVELHTDITQQSKYAFRNGADGYRVMLTQINKADITDRTLHPTYNASLWQMAADSPLTIEEFWFMLFSAACDTSNQQLATADAVKEIFGEPKLQVFDAQLYNQFDSVWIKDWVKKPIGGGSE
ncbi:MAG: DUF3713 domain-containing protein [Mycoplasmoidaceae bacterium]